jgi:hypothetical protein
MNDYFTQAERRAYQGRDLPLDEVRLGQDRGYEDLQRSGHLGSRAEEKCQKWSKRKKFVSAKLENQNNFRKRTKLAHAGALACSVHACTGDVKGKCSSHRVTRLGKFSHVCLFALGSYIKITVVAQIFWLFYSTVKLMN